MLSFGLNKTILFLFIFTIICAGFTLLIVQKAYSNTLYFDEALVDVPTFVQKKS